LPEVQDWSQNNRRKVGPLRLRRQRCLWWVERCQRILRCIARECRHRERSLWTRAARTYPGTLLNKIDKAPMVTSHSSVYRYPSFPAGATRTILWRMLCQTSFLNMLKSEYYKTYYKNSTNIIAIYLQINVNKKLINVSSIIFIQKMLRALGYLCKYKALHLIWMLKISTLLLKVSKNVLKLFCFERDIL